MIRYLINEEELLNAPVPERTESYTPVPNSTILKELTGHLDSLGYTVKNSTHLSDSNYKKFISRIDLLAPDEEMGYSVMFRNSYDKSMSVGFCAGGNVWVCANGMVHSDSNIQFTRRHTGDCHYDVLNKMDIAVGQLDDVFQQLIIDREDLKQIELDRTTEASLIGQMLINEEIIKHNQISIIKNELDNSEFFKGNSAWDLYNHCTFAYKQSHPTEYIKNHQKLHSFFKESLLTQ